MLEYTQLQHRVLLDLKTAYVQGVRMLQQVITAVSIFIILLGYLSAMEIPSLKEITAQRIFKFITQDPHSCVTTFTTLPSELSCAIIQHLIATNKYKNALPILLLSFKHHQQQQSNAKQRKMRLNCSNDKQIELTREQGRQFVQASVCVKSLLEDIVSQDSQLEEVPLPLLTQDQVTALLSYISIINALNISDSILPVVQQEIPETAALSFYCLTKTALHQLKEYLIACTIPTLCDLIIAASYLDIQNSEHTSNFIELATQALGDKLIQAPYYQDEYNVISTLPTTIQCMLVRYLIDTSKIRSTLCSNSTDVITNTAQILTNHNAGVNSVAWSPDGKYIAGGSYKKIKVWDTTTGTCTHTLKGHTDSIYSVSWSSNGKHIASSSGDGTIKIWDATNGNCIQTISSSTDAVYSVSWSPDGNQLATDSHDNTITIWDTTNGSCIQTLKGHTHLIKLVIWSPDGSMIASGAANDIVKIWDAITGSCIHTLIAHKGVVYSISWSPDSKQLTTSGTADGTIKIWDASTGVCLQILTSYSYPINSVAWSPDGKYIAGGSYNNTVRIWDASTGTYIYTLEGYTDAVCSVAWSIDSNKLAIGSFDKTIIVWDILNKERTNYLQDTLTWEQALLLARIVNAYTNKQNINLAQYTRAQQCYDSLDQQVKQLIKPLLP